VKFIPGCAAAAVLLLCTCAPAWGARGSASVAPTPAPSDASSLAVIAQAVAREVNAFSAGVSAADWLKANPGEKLIVREPLPYDADARPERGDWCFRTQRVVLAGAGAPTIVRKIYFYPPRMPADGALPTLSEGGDDEPARQACKAQMMRLEIGGLGAASASAVSQAIELQLSGYLGRKRTIVPAPSRTDLMGLARWRKGRTVIAIERYSSHDDVIASTPEFQESIAAARAQIYLGPDYQQEKWILDQALKIAQPGEGLAQRFEAFQALASSVGAGAPPPPSREPPGEDVVRAAARLLRKASRWPAPRRAAALVACDRVIAIGEQTGILNETATASPAKGPAAVPGKPINVIRLERVGAQFNYSKRAGSWYYAMTFAQRARELDPDGRAGGLAYLAMAERGFDTSSTCEQGPEQFRRVISQAAPLLRGKPAADIALRVHLLVGDAYAAVVALADAPQNEFFAPAKYAPEEARARENAIVQYRAALALDPRGALGAAAWDKAWRLLVGLAPMSIRFYCVYQ
jgi:hypothetical protein